MADPVKNFAIVTVSTGYDDAATSITLATGDGAKLPSPATDGAFNLVWWHWSMFPSADEDSNAEIVRVTARTGDVLTITRAQEGTSASIKNSSGTYKMALTFTKKMYDDINNFSIDINRYGFVDNTKTNISISGTTFTLSDLGSGWSYYRTGVKYVITGNKTVTIASGMNFIYIDNINGTLSNSGSSWTLSDTKVPVATVYYNSTLTPTFIMADERHTCAIDRAFHKEHHFVEGTRLSQGCTLTGSTTGSTTDTNKTFAISEAVVFDEDLYFTLSGIADGNGSSDTNYFILYRTDATTWAWKTSTMPFYWSGAIGAEYIRYDLNGTMTQASANNRYINTYLLATTAKDNNEGQSLARFCFVPGRAEFTSTATAYAELFSSFSMVGFPFAEAIALYQLTWMTTGNTSGKCNLNRIQAIQTNIIQTSATAIGTHNTLAGLQGGVTGEYYHLTSSQLNNILPMEIFYGIR